MLSNIEGSEDATMGGKVEQTATKGRDIIKMYHFQNRRSTQEDGKERCNGIERFGGKEEILVKWQDHEIETLITIYGEWKKN